MDKEGYLLGDGYSHDPETENYEMTAQEAGTTIALLKYIAAN